MGTHQNEEKYLVEEERGSKHEESEGSGDESEDEEPRIKMFWVIFPERCRKRVFWFTA